MNKAYVINEMENTEGEIQTKLSIPFLEKETNENVEKSSVNNIFVNDDLNSFPLIKHSKEGSKGYTETTIKILDDDYDFIYDRFQNNPLNANPHQLVKEFLMDAIMHQIEIMRKEDEEFQFELTIPEATLKQLNGMVFYHEKQEHKPISLNTFFIMMVEELYQHNKGIYDKMAKLSDDILEGDDSH